MKKVIYQRPNHFSHLKVMREQNQLCDVTIQVPTYINIVVINFST